MAFMVWCVKYDRPDLFKTGDNLFLRPEQEFEDWDYQACYSAADTMLEMLRSDVFMLVSGGKEGLRTTFGSWAEGIRDVLQVLGWRVCDEWHMPTGARCDVEITAAKPHGPKHEAYEAFDSEHLAAVWP